MPLTSSIITQNILHSDGSRRITEMHIDHLGNKYPVDYIAAPGANISTLMTLHGNNILSQLAIQELSEIRQQVIEGADIRTINQEFSRLDDLKAIFVDYLAEANREQSRIALEQSRIDAANTAIK